MNPSCVGQSDCFDPGPYSTGQATERDTAPETANLPSTSGDGRLSGLLPRSPELPRLGNRLVVASNRVIDPNRPAAGGLAVALGDMMREPKAYGSAGPVQQPTDRIGPDLKPNLSGGLRWLESI